MSNPHDVAAVLGGLLSDQEFRNEMDLPERRRATLLAYGFVDVTDDDHIRIGKVMASLKGGKLSKAQKEVDDECPNWPCPII